VGELGARIEGERLEDRGDAPLVVFLRGAQRGHLLVEADELGVVLAQLGVLAQPLEHRLRRLRHEAAARPQRVPRPLRRGALALGAFEGAGAVGAGARDLGAAKLELGALGHVVGAAAQLVGVGVGGAQRALEGVLERGAIALWALAGALELGPRRVAQRAQPRQLLRRRHRAAGVEP